MDFHFPKSFRLIMNVGEVGAIQCAVQATMPANVGTLIPVPVFSAPLAVGEPGSGLWDTSHSTCLLLLTGLTRFSVRGLSDSVG